MEFMVIIQQIGRYYANEENYNSITHKSLYFTNNKYLNYNSKYIIQN